MQSLQRAVAVTLSLAALSGCASPRWNGRYPTAEYRLTVRTKAGEPAPGVRLEVVTGEGKPAYDFPVDDYHRGTTLVSDARGNITFHHVGGGYELRASCMKLLGLLPVTGLCDDVKFSLRFVAGGSVAHTLDFDRLHDAFPATAEGAAGFRALPTTRAPFALRVDRARTFMHGLDPRARQSVRGFESRAEWDAIVNTRLDFKVIEREVRLP